MTAAKHEAEDSDNTCNCAQANDRMSFEESVEVCQTNSSPWSSTHIMACPQKRQSTGIDTHQSQDVEDTFMQTTQGFTLHTLKAWSR